MIEKQIQWIKNDTIPRRSYDALVEFNKMLIFSHKVSSVALAIRSVLGI